MHNPIHYNLSNQSVFKIFTLMFDISDDNKDDGEFKSDNVEHPSGEFEIKKRRGWESFAVKLRTLIAYQHVRQGSVLYMMLRGKVCSYIFSCLIIR